MASYTPCQYREQRRIQAIIGEANARQRCPICGRPQGRWPSGARRMTCGRAECYQKWLAIHPAAKEQT